MTVRLGLLALLDEQPMYGYQLRAEFESRTGGTWPLNIGQVYTTLARLDRDGLVTAEGDDGEGHQVYALTDAGRAEIEQWFATPVARADRPRRKTRPNRSPQPIRTSGARAHSSLMPTLPAGRAGRQSRRTPVAA